jgi:hypothetical protein
MPPTSLHRWRRSVSFPKPWRATVHRQGRFPKGPPTAWNFCGRRRAALPRTQRAARPIATTRRRSRAEDPRALWKRCRPAGPGIAGSSPAEVVDFAWHDARAERKNKAKRVTSVGFEPTPLRAGAFRQRLKPIGQTVMADASGNKTTKNVAARGNAKPTPTRVQLRGPSPRPCGLAAEASALDHSAKLSLEAGKMVCARAAEQISPWLNEAEA